MIGYWHYHKTHKQWHGETEDDGKPWWPTVDEPSILLERKLHRANHEVDKELTGREHGINNLQGKNITLWSCRNYII